MSVLIVAISECSEVTFGDLQKVVVTDGEILMQMGY